MNAVNRFESVEGDLGGAPLRMVRRERFAQLVRLDIPGVDAMREAGFVGATPENARRLLNTPEVKARVAYLRRQEEDVWREKLRLCEERLQLWHNMEWGGYYHVVEEPLTDKEGAAVLDGAGDPIMVERQRLKPFAELTHEQQMAIESLTYNERGIPNLKLYSKLDVNRELRKLNGLDVQRESGEGAFDRVPDAELFQQLARKAAELGKDFVELVTVTSVAFGEQK